MKISPINSYNHKAQKSFGKFRFERGAVEFLQANLTTRAEADSFENIVDNEAQHDRTLVVRTTGDHKRRLYTVYGGRGFEQGKFEAPLNYLSSLTKTANKIDIRVAKDREKYNKEHGIADKNQSPIAKEIKRIAEYA